MSRHDVAKALAVRADLALEAARTILPEIELVGIAVDGEGERYVSGNRPRDRWDTEKTYLHIEFDPAGGGTRTAINKSPVRFAALAVLEIRVRIASGEADLNRISGAVLASKAFRSADGLTFGGSQAEPGFVLTDDEDDAHFVGQIQAPFTYIVYQGEPS